MQLGDVLTLCFTFAIGGLRGILVDCRKDFSGWSDCSMSGPKFLLSQQQWSTMRVHFASALAILSFQGYLEACQRPCSLFFRLALFGLSWTMQLWPCCYLMVAKNAFHNLTGLVFWVVLQYVYVHAFDAFGRLCSEKLSSIFFNCISLTVIARCSLWSHGDIWLQAMAWEKLLDLAVYYLFMERGVATPSRSRSDMVLPRFTVLWFCCPPLLAFSLPRSAPPTWRWY